MVDVKRMVDACFKQFHRVAIILSNAKNTENYGTMAGPTLNGWTIGRL
jgi:hypothetical protein